MNHIESESTSPRVLEHIFHALNLRVYVLLVAGCLILLFDIAANAQNSEAIDGWGILGLALGCLAAFGVKLARDFRARRGWTLVPVTRLLPLLGLPNIPEELRRPDVLAAFGIDEKPHR